MVRRYPPVLLVLISLIWGTFLFAALGITQRRFFADVALALIQQGWAILVAGGILLAGVGMGTAIVRAIRLQGVDEERWVATGLTGIGLLATLWLWMGLIAVPPIPITLLLLIIGWLCLWRWRFPIPTLPTLSRRVWMYVAVVLGFSLIQALLPATTFDELLYHLRLPELWLASGTLYPPQHEPQFYFPVLIEALFTMALQFSGESAAHLIHWGALPLILILLWQLTRRFMSNVSIGLIWVIALSIQMLPALASWAYTDIYLALFQVGVVWALLIWRQEYHAGWLAVAGISAGLALGVKYLALFTPLLAIVMISVLHRRHPTQAIRAIFLFGGIACLVALPSYLRNIIATGNPIFPFLLPTPYWDEFRSAWYAAAGTGIGFSLPEILALPYTITIGQHDANYFDGRPGLLISTFLPLAVLLWIWQREHRPSQFYRTIGWLLFFSAGYGIIWLVGVVNSAALRQGRFLLPPLLLLTPVVAWGLTLLPRFDLPTFRPSFLVRFLVGAWAGFALLVTVADIARANPIQALVYSPSEWQIEQWGAYGELVATTNTLPPASRLLLWYEPRSYKMPTTVYPDTIVVQFAWRLLEAQGNLDGLDERLCQEGYSHIAIYQRGVRFMRENGDVNTIDDEVYRALQTWTTSHNKVWEDSMRWYEMYEVGCN
jgi:hypothetical protein